LETCCGYWYGQRWNSTLNRTRRSRLLPLVFMGPPWSSWTVRILSLFFPTLEPHLRLILVSGLLPLIKECSSVMRKRDLFPESRLTSQRPALALPPCPFEAIEITSTFPLRWFRNFDRIPFRYGLGGVFVAQLSARPPLCCYHKFPPSLRPDSPTSTCC